MRDSTHLSQRAASQAIEWAAAGPLIADDLAAASLDAPVFETARMYSNGRPPEDIARVFGVTTFELG